MRRRNGSLTADLRCKARVRCLRGADSLALLLQHVLPKGFRRVRDFGLLHPRRKRLLTRMQLLLQVYVYLPDSLPPARCTLHCTRCGATMRIVATRLTPSQAHRRRNPHHGHRSHAM